MLPVLLDRLTSGVDLDSDQARWAMTRFVSGEATGVEIASLLVALRIKGATGAELAAFSEVLREKAERVETGIPNLVDTCGTGGGIPSFNISTAAAIVASAAGAKIAKHGNRAVTSSCGSADVLEALGIRLDRSLSELETQLKSEGLAFLFAPAHHPALKFVGPVRKELGVRTVFNQLGPLANPAGATRQLIGVYDEAMLVPMGEALLLLGAERALVVHGTDGLDEISPCAPTRAVRLLDGNLEEILLQPSSFGLVPLEPGALTPGTTLEEAATILRLALTDADSVRAQAVFPSVGAALWLGGIAEDLAVGAEMSRQAIADGRALAKLEAIR